MVSFPYLLFFLFSPLSSFSFLHPLCPHFLTNTVKFIKLCLQSIKAWFFQAVPWFLCFPPYSSYHVDVIINRNGGELRAIVDKLPSMSMSIRPIVHACFLAIYFQRCASSTATARTIFIVAMPVKTIRRLRWCTFTIMLQRLPSNVINLFDWRRSGCDPARVWRSINSANIYSCVTRDYPQMRI